jgi:hypothetical protein
MRHYRNLGAGCARRKERRLSRDDIGSLQRFGNALIGLPLSHLWRGAGSAIFLEFGQLAPPTRTRRDGTPFNPRGEFGLMIEWSWRIENSTSILCGSWSKDRLWEPTFDLLRGKVVVELSAVGRLPEIVVGLTEDLYVSSFMTSDGDPQWSLFDRRSAPVTWLCVRDGCLKIEVSKNDHNRLGR